jgi:hypothetical protein
MKKEVFPKTNVNGRSKWLVFPAFPFSIALDVLSSVEKSATGERVKGSFLVLQITCKNHGICMYTAQWYRKWREERLANDDICHPTTHLRPTLVFRGGGVLFISLYSTNIAKDK